MSKRDQIRAALEVLHPQHLELLDESHTHANGYESHYKVTLVSPDFIGLNSLKRHQRVYAAMGSLMSQIHALAIHTYTPQEWELLAGAPASPACSGAR